MTQPGPEATDRTEHPEYYCHRCGGPNVSWSTPSPLWNAVMRGGSINGDEMHNGIVCPVCFADIAENRGIADQWRLSAQRVRVELELVTPSGRVWDEQTWMWREPEPVSTTDRRGRVSAKLRSPYLCNWPGGVPDALADLLDAIPPTLDFPATVDPWELITMVWVRADSLVDAILREES